MSDLVGNPEDQFSHNEAHIINFADFFIRNFKLHYDNTPMQYTARLNGCKNDNFLLKTSVFLIFAQNINCGYTLESSHLGGSNEYIPTIYALEQK